MSTDKAKQTWVVELDNGGSGILLYGRSLGERLATLSIKTIAEITAVKLWADGEEVTAGVQVREGFPTNVELAQMLRFVFMRFLSAHVTGDEISSDDMGLSDEHEINGVEWSTAVAAAIGKYTQPLSNGALRIIAKNALGGKPVEESEAWTQRNGELIKGLDVKSWLCPVDMAAILESLPPMPVSEPELQSAPVAGNKRFNWILDVFNGEEIELQIIQGATIGQALADMSLPDIAGITRIGDATPAPDAEEQAEFDAQHAAYLESDKAIEDHREYAIGFIKHDETLTRLTREESLAVRDAVIDLSVSEDDATKLLAPAIGGDSEETYARLMVRTVRKIITEQEATAAACFRIAAAEASLDLRPALASISPPEPATERGNVVTTFSDVYGQPVALRVETIVNSNDDLDPTKSFAESTAHLDAGSWPITVDIAAICATLAAEHAVKADAAVIKGSVLQDFYCDGKVVTVFLDETGDVEAVKTEELANPHDD